MLENAVIKERPIYQDVQRLTDAQLSTMCQNHQIFLGPITSANRRFAERHLHVAMIEARAKYRAHQQFAEECTLRISSSFQPVPPPQQHYGMMNAVHPRPTVVPQNYWPSPGSFKMRGPPPPTRFFQNPKERPDPVLEPRQYVAWRQQNKLRNQTATDFGTKILGFKMPFSLDAARDLSSRISSTIKRFQGGGEEFQQESAKPEQDKNEMADHQEKYQDANQAKYRNAYQEDYQGEYEEQSETESEKEGSPKDLEHPYDVDMERDTLSDDSEDDGEQQENEKQTNPRSFSHDLLELKNLFNGADAEPQSELGDYKSFISLASVYHEFTNPEPMERKEKSVDKEPLFRWWWLRRASAGDERIPEEERTTEQDLMQERELKTINYLSEAHSRVDDGMLELMGRVELRDDSDEEGAVEGGPRSRSCAGFCRHIFHLLCCDRHGKLDADKLRCSFFCCCMAFGIYVAFKMMR
ncbi:uncharacterized protein LOC108044884 [Drosophila rhopaloa]|uniref:Uncharacterized protein LOC108044884 n=1 Tax=Drosophila rhopaloa TaxID=1041015 RepID=A0A6P4EWP2_DRORH|nr:uncharacterized protein LOC108044884 [Drosophila rhopaloa]